MAISPSFFKSSPIILYSLLNQKNRDSSKMIRNPLVYSHCQKYLKISSHKPSSNLLSFHSHNEKVANGSILCYLEKCKPINDKYTTKVYSGHYIIWLSFLPQISWAPQGNSSHCCMARNSSEQTSCPQTPISPGFWIMSYLPNRCRSIAAMAIILIFIEIIPLFPKVLPFHYFVCK